MTIDYYSHIKCNDEIERQENEELQGLLCGTLMVITQKLGKFKHFISFIY
jgi:hypothetical protein